ncbi:wd g-beta repeat-containing protein [Sesbania bispinosa]|nr:wd g-beta repeat-containing protein [Sesbania bispinosa]
MADSWKCLRLVASTSDGPAAEQRRWLLVMGSQDSEQRKANGKEKLWRMTAKTLRKKKLSKAKI